MRYVLDTHALIWHLTNDGRLGENARRVLDDKNAQLLIPLIVLAEAKHIANRKRVPISFDEILQTVISMSRCTIFPMDIFTVTYIPDNLDIHDRLIVAAALHCREFFNDEVTILTNDIAITESGLTPVIW